MTSNTVISEFEPFPLAKNIIARVCSFGLSTRLDIRHYKNDMPTTKGVVLRLSDWEMLKNNQSRIDEQFDMLRMQTESGMRIRVLASKIASKSKKIRRAVSFPKKRKKKSILNVDRFDDIENFS